MTMRALRGIAVAVLPAALVLITPEGGRAQGSARMLDDFETLEGWSARPAEGVSLSIRLGEGRGGRGGRGRAMRMDFDFHGRGGYAIAHKSLTIALPANYAFSFWLRAESPVNTLEFKLIDSTGDNVWWSRRRDYEFPRQWTKLTIRRRDITFAWGPAQGGELSRVAAIEIVVTAARGGSGSVWIDDLELTPLEPPVPYSGTPRVAASSWVAGAPPDRAVDGDPETAWRAARPGAWLMLDFGRPREYGGLILDWGREHATSYVVETSADGVRWDVRRTITDGDGGRDPIDLPETESRYVRIRVRRTSGGQGVSLRELTVQPVAWAATPNDFIRAVARDAPRGSYPRAFSGEQPYWTVVGVSGDTANALLSEDGALEVGRGEFTVEPFLFARGRLLTWADVTARQSLEREDLPIPSVEWEAGSLALRVTAAATGQPGDATLLARYRLTNRGARDERVTLYLAVRPFQVNPPWQSLNGSGGVAPIRSITARGRAIIVNGRSRIFPITSPSSFRAATLDQGGLLPALRRGGVPAHRSAIDSLGRAAGVLGYRLVLSPGASREVWLAIPLSGGGRVARWGPVAAERALAATRAWWEGSLDRVTIELPPSAGDLVATVRSSLAYTLISRRGAAIRPGSRSYARSWIRDGALIGAALLRLGHSEEVRDFIAWYAPYQYPSGRVPCCVDERGADPVAENDSDGELIYLIAEYYRYTGDRALVERVWPHVVRAMTHLDSLRHARLTPEYDAPERRVFRGLLPQSISHEGYSAKPMHSYWDDFFALEGAKDAASLAAVLGRESESVHYRAVADALRRDILASLELAMVRHGIDYLPGSTELGDFDATSTTIAIAPVGELGALPPQALRRTFERYWDAFRARRDGTVPWDSYTPYELRTVGTFVRLGWRSRAHEALAFFLEGRRPAGWREWAEVVWHDSRTPRFIGDMPHGWVAGDFLRSVLDLFAYVREADSALVIGAGVPPSWVAAAPGVRVRGLRTPYGPLDLTMRADPDGETVRVTVGGLTRVPPGGVVVCSPLERPVVEAEVSKIARIVPPDTVILHRIPATLTLRYRR